MALEVLEDPAHRGEYHARREAWEAEELRARGRRETARGVRPDRPAPIDRAWDWLTHPREWGQGTGGERTPEQSHRDAGQALTDMVLAAEATARRLHPPPAPPPPAMPSPQPKRSRIRLKPDEAAEVRDAVRQRDRRLGLPPTPVTAEEADRLEAGLPIEGEPRLPGPRLLTPRGARSLDELRHGLGEGLGRELRGRGVPNAPGAYPYPRRPAEASPGPQSRASSSGGDPMEKVAALLERFVEAQEQAPAFIPLVSPPRSTYRMG